MVAKKKLPAHGNLGKWAGKSQNDVFKKVIDEYDLPNGATIYAYFSHMDSPFMVFDVEVITKRKRATKEKKKQ